MPRKTKTSGATKPAQIYSLTGDQARWLREGRDTDGGVYVSVVRSGSGELVDAGLAEYRAVRRSGGTRGPRDPRPCEWTDYYLVPTPTGLELLDRYDLQVAVEVEP